jgi:hypothetical protein
LCGYGKELSALPPVNILHIYHAKVDFVHQSRGLERVAGPLIPHVMPRHPVQLVVYLGRQPVKRLVTAAPSSQ